MLPVAGFHSREDNSEAMSLLESRDWLVVEGWEVRFYNLFLKYKQEIINLFSFDNNISSKVMDMMNADSRPNSIKLGVHVRRGDYKIGAPSTSSLMASMYHDTPVYWMMSDKEDIHFDTFNNMFTHIV